LPAPFEPSTATISPRSPQGRCRAGSRSRRSRRAGRDREQGSAMRRPRMRAAAPWPR
jgi:hypothetical protein